MASVEVPSLSLSQLLVFISEFKKAQPVADVIGAVGTVVLSVHAARDEALLD